MTEYLSNVWDAITGHGLSISIPFEKTGYMNPKLQDTMTIEREIFTDYSTIGKIYFDGEMVCHSLELSCRKANPGGKLAIPNGHYEVVISKSPHLGYFTPELLDVPGRTGIRIHRANWPKELEGCIAPGLRTDVDAIYDSRNAFEIVYAEVGKRLAKAPLFVSIIGGRT